MFSTHKIKPPPSHRETNSGLRGVYVYEVGTSPYFSNVAPGEVTDLPTEEPPQEEVPDVKRHEYTEQYLEYPPYDAGQVEVHPVHSYQPHQPENQEVVVVDDTDLNVDGESGAVSSVLSPSQMPISAFSALLLPHLYSVPIQPGDMCQQQEQVLSVC